MNFLGVLHRNPKCRRHHFQLTLKPPEAVNVCHTDQRNVPIRACTAALILSTLFFVFRWNWFRLWHRTTTSLFLTYKAPICQLFLQPGKQQSMSTISDPVKSQEKIRDVGSDSEAWNQAWFVSKDGKMISGLIVPVQQVNDRTFKMSSFRCCNVQYTVIITCCHSNAGNHASNAITFS